MSTERDQVAYLRLWKAVEGQVRNHQRYYRKHEYTGALARVDRQIHVGLYGLARACRPLSFDDLGVPAICVDKAASLFMHTHLAARRSSAEEWASLCQSLVSQNPLAQPESALALLESLQWLPDETRQHQLPVLLDSLDHNGRSLLEQLLGLYLPPELRSRLISAENDLPKQIVKHPDYVHLTERYAGLCKVHPGMYSVFWQLAAEKPRFQREGLLHDQPEEGYRLLAMSTCEKSMTQIIEGLDTPHTNASAYLAWLARTDTPLPRVAQLSEVGGQQKQAGKSFADAQAARDYWAKLASTLKQFQQTMPRYVSDLDDAFWCRMGGFERTGHLVRALPAHLRPELDTPQTGEVRNAS